MKHDLSNRLRFWLEGHIYVGHKSRPGWRGTLPFYAFKCPIHGIVENYPHGYEQRLECPLCLEEMSE